MGREQNLGPNGETSRKNTSTLELATPMRKMSYLSHSLYAIFEEPQWKATVDFRWIRENKEVVGSNISNKNNDSNYILLVKLMEKVVHVVKKRPLSSQKSSSSAMVSGGHNERKTEQIPLIPLEMSNYI